MKHQTFFNIILILCLNTFIFNLVSAQMPTWTIYHPNNSLLPSDTVYVIVKDTLGNKWIGTENGLVKFDGTNWIIYNTTNSGIPSNQIRSITFDKLGNQWIGTGKGLAKFDGTNWTVYNPLNSLVLGWDVRGVAIDSHNNKWVASKYITKLDSLGNNVNGWGLPYCNGTIPDTNLTCIVSDSRDMKWIGTDLEGATFCDNFLIHSNIGPVNTIVLTNDDSMVWIGGKYGFLSTNYILPNCAGYSLALHYPSGINVMDNNVTAIAFDGCNYLWIGTKSGGLGCYVSNLSAGFDLTQSNTPLPTNEINCITIFGSEKWIGTSKGLVILNSSCNFTALNEALNIPNGLEVFPNPAEEMVTIKLPDSKFATVMITDCFGREIFKREVVREILTIDTSNFPKGIFFVQVIHNDKKLSCKLFKN